MKLGLYKLKKEINFRSKFWSNNSKKESVFFFTFHKCASSLFSSFVLRNLDDYKHVDYQKYLVNKRITFNKDLNFPSQGFIFGPIRLSSPDKLDQELLIKPATDHIRKKKTTAIFFIRDPRDILISAYYSFGFTHGLNAVKEKRDVQIALRNKIQKMTLDEYALAYADQQIEFFNKMKNLMNACENNVVLKYEDLIDNFDYFIRCLSKFVTLEDGVKNEFYKRSRPKVVVDSKSHRRSGQTRKFEKELKDETLIHLNKKLKSVLNDFDYKL